MAYTAQTLIARAYYLSGVVSRQGQVVSGDQITDGLYMLNALLDFKQIETDLIPYWTYNTTFVCVPGQETYFIPNCAEIETITFNISTVRYSMNNVNRDTYYGASRIDNIDSLPFNYNFDRTLGGGNLSLYFVPSQAYPLKFMGKFFLTDVTLQQDMALTYDTSYIEYLRYALAEYICNENDKQFNPDQKAILTKMERKLMYISPPDLTMRKKSILQDQPGYNWGDVNQGLGWR